MLMIKMGIVSVTDYRSDIFGDPLHSKPLAVTYTESGIDVVRLLVGTNAGFLHMFTDHGDNGSEDSDNSDDRVTENWAFIPEELLNFGLSRYGMRQPQVIHQYGMGPFTHCN